MDVKICKTQTPAKSADELRAQILQELEGLPNDDLVACVALISAYKHEPSQESVQGLPPGDLPAPCLLHT